MQTDPPVTVLMTVYDGGRYLDEAVSSILAQTFPDFEFLIVDNGSTDETPDILMGLSDERLRIRRLQFNLGRTGALNYALNTARGKYIAVLDADDVALPERLAEQMRWFESSPETALLGSWYELIDDDGKRIETRRAPTAHQDIVDATASENPFAHSTTMFRRSVAIELGGYPWQYRHSQDAGLWFRALKEHRTAILGRVLARIRRHPGQVSSKSPLQALETIRLRKEALTSLPLSVSARRRARLFLWASRLIYLQRLATTWLTRTRSR